MPYQYKNQPIEILTQPIQWLEFERYQQDVALNHRLNQEYDFTGSLCYLNHNDFFDPWLLASQLVQKTGKKPLVAVNPAYHHPYIIARSAFTLSEMRKGPIALNFIAGMATTDLHQIGQMLDKEARYKRLREMMQVIRNYLYKKEPWTFEGEYYQIECTSFLGDVRYKPEFFVGGHSIYAQQLVEQFETVWARSLLPNDLTESSHRPGLALGFGIHIAENAEVAKQELRQKLSLDKTGEVLFRLKMSNTDAQWKQEQAKGLDDASLHPNYFPNTIQSQVNVPFLVGAESELRQLVQRQFLDRGIRAFIIPMVDEAAYRMVRDLFSQVE